MRADSGTENLEVRRLMIARWGEQHLAFLRGRSVHNVRIERLWRDVREHTLDTFRALFTEMEESRVLDMDNIVHRLALRLAYEHRIRQALEDTKNAYNHHRIRTGGYQSPLRMFARSRARAMREGYWDVDPGDHVQVANPQLYGLGDDDDIIPPAHQLDRVGEVNAAREELDRLEEAEVRADMEALDWGRACLHGLDLTRDDGNLGQDVYQEAVAVLQAALNARLAP
ncbi:hypothetical protein SISNIDRAFT_463993 [Sistotremastrum niveocremeum HHB9708]|uniref:Integrase core domain-containing protein n=1 Tax=Sistotremastrum niveocremeum HHB9708 TaxID=1314777 RepID=A0A164Y2Q0_9AGAM|nr:hypothetical protein SISNIDRAFT_463993 [Sistotremastrum niveocremeum HHB9708]